MRIAHISDCYAPRVGGIEKQVRDLARAQAREGHDVHVLTATGAADGTMSATEDDGGVTVHRMGTRFAFGAPVNPFAGRTIRAILDYAAPDVAHVHAGVFSPFAYEGITQARAADIPAVITWHCIVDGGRPLLWALASLKGLQSSGVRLTAVSHVAAERVATVIPGVEVGVLPNGAALDVWRRDEPPPPAAWETPLEVVSTMRLAPRKRPIPLLRIVRQAHDEVASGGGRPIRLTLVGDGLQERAVRDHVREHRMEDYVRLTGRVGRVDLARLYRRQEVFLSPVRLEAFGIAALEARAAGLAMAILRGSGPEEFVADRVDGLVCADDAGLSDALVRYAREPETLREIREHNTEIAPPFSWRDAVDAALREYNVATRSARRVERA